MQTNEQARARTERWRKWEADLWNGLNAALDVQSTSGAARRFDDLWIMLDFLNDDGLIQLSAVDAVLPTPGGMLRGYCLRLHWDRHETTAVVEAVLEMVAKVRADPIFRLLHKKPS